MLILKDQLNNQLNIAALKKNSHTTKCFVKCSFFLRKFISTYLIKVFVSFVKLLNISLAEYSLFPSHLKSVFFKQWSGMNRKEYTCTSFQDYHKYIILCDLKYSATQVHFWRRSKARLISPPKVNRFIYS